MIDARDVPLDSVSTAALAAQALELRRIDAADAADFDAYLQAETRGFHDPARGERSLAAARDAIGTRRLTGVRDTGLTAPEPVATVDSFVTELSVPGARTIDSWAISDVTVAPTHRRRGIARALLEGELRSASGAGLAIAMLTVSESTIYARYGFAPAAFAADWVLDTRRVRWEGEPPAGRLRFVDRQAFPEVAGRLHERIRRGIPGQIPVWPGRWIGFARLADDDPSGGADLRVVVFDDPDGEAQGIVLYRVLEGDREASFSDHVVEVVHLVAATPGAELALWRMLTELDLVSELRADLRRIDEPVRWRIADWRAARVRTRDQQWLRILDVPAALAARGYRVDGDLALEVTDRLGFAAGRFVLRAASGSAVAETVDELPDDVPALALEANDLAALYLGGVRPQTLVAAGRIRELTAGAAGVADLLLGSDVEPWLSVWY